MDTPVRYYDTLNLDDTVWEETTAWVPHYCIITETWIWPGTKAMYGIRNFTVLPRREYFWADKHAWLIERLKGEL